MFLLCPLNVYSRSLYGATPLRYNERSVDIDVMIQGMSFGFVYMASIFLVALALGGVRGGLGDRQHRTGARPLIGPSGTFQPLPDGAKWVLSAAMLLGRLEFLTLLVLFGRAFWRG